MNLSERCKHLRKKIVEEKAFDKAIYAVYPFLYDEGAWEQVTSHADGKFMRIAAGMANVMKKAPAILLEDELLVGYNYADEQYASFWSPEDNAEDIRHAEDAGYSRQQVLQQRERHKALLAYDMNGLFDRNSFSFSAVKEKMDDPRFPFLKKYTKQEIELNEEWAAMGRCMTDNHTLIGYERVLTKGFSGLLQDIERAEAQNGASEMYDAMKLLCRAAGEHAANYARMAEKMAAETTCSPGRRAELLKIAGVCRHVPMQPARTFHEALQSLVFAHYFSTWEDGVNANSLGRLDQILYPFYRRDLDSGILTADEAYELICCLWLKFYRDYDVQQSCVGGCDAEGRDAVNDLSWMMLDATEQLDFIRCLSVRFGSYTPKAFLKRALEVVGRVKKGVPFFFNDDVLIPALCAKNVSLIDARNYSQLGCVETAIPGMSNPHAVSGETNLLKALEYVLGNGRSLFAPDRRPGLETGEAEAFSDYDVFLAAVYKQIENLLDVTCKWVCHWREAAAKYNPKPYKSLLTSDCIQCNRDFNDGGARYDYYQIMLGGIPNLADSLLVVRKRVFENKDVSMADLLYQIRNNFPDETFRLDCLNKFAKFGNDDEADALASQITEYACDVLDRLEKKYGMTFYAQPFTYLWLIDHGRQSAASPDGRRAGEPIAYSVSPMQGRDSQGVTALLNSLSKLPTKRCPGTASAIVEVDPMLMNDDHSETFADLLFACGKHGLANVQFNTVNAETLLDAQRHPEKYNNLAVRVSGFSQKFNLLDKPLQDHIIERTKHACL